MLVANSNAYTKIAVNFSFLSLLILFFLYLIDELTHLVILVKMSRLFSIDIL